jgi:tyrosyl-tRNA synthetase
MSNKDTEQPQPEWSEDLQQDYDRVLSVGEECISPGELKALLLAKRPSNARFNLYDGFEPSGRMHIAQGVFKAMNVNKCTQSGGTFIFWVADWFALMNDKMGGDLDKIRVVGEYLQEVWKAAGMNLDHVVFKWASEEITQQANTYWPLLLDIARRFNITRIKKCCQIMGRLEGALTAAQILYPLMQCTDVFFLKADICQLGVDQRKVNMLAREYCDFARLRKPIILSHHMLYGLKAGQEKMSKSDPDSAVFMEDATEDVERKILQAYCPNQEEQPEETTAHDDEDAGKESMHLKQDLLKNPCLDYIQHIIFSPPGATFVAAGNTFVDFDAVKEAFLSGTLSEEELKGGLIAALNELLEPVRQHFTTDRRAKELLQKVQQFKKEAAPLHKLIRRLDLIQLNQIEAESHLVFAPLPTATPTLQEAVDVLQQLKASSTINKILYLSDWTARVCNACDADVKAIAAYYEILVTSLQALDSTTMANTKILYQSHAILMDPSNYWVSVINVGRHFMLNQVMDEEMKDSDGVGSVIGRLMQVADVMGVAPATVALGSQEVVPAKLMTDFYAAKLEGMVAPTISHVDGPSLLLQQRELDAHKTENDEYYLLDDPKVNGKSKVKKAFCEPGNIDYNPPIVLASTFGGENVVVSRSPDNGGDVTYTSRQDMERDFASGELHPGDLKNAVSSIMVCVLEKCSEGVKANVEATKAAKTLKAFAKKMTKSKGKK